LKTNAEADTAKVAEQIAEQTTLHAREDDNTEAAEGYRLMMEADAEDEFVKALMNVSANSGSGAGVGTSSDSRSVEQGLQGGTTAGKVLFFVCAVCSVRT
jgi:hypothetical protein